MHATLHQLLILRDQVIPDSAVAAHVQDCVECRTELHRLQAVTASLRNLPSRWTPPDRWPQVQAGLSRDRLERVPASERRWPGWLLPAASAAVVVAAVLMTINMQGDRSRLVSAMQTTALPSQRTNEPVVSEQSPVAPQTTTEVGPIASGRHELLVAESQRLEEMLTVLPDEPRVTRAMTAVTVADLEDRIKWVDYRLNVGAESGIEPRQSQSLWQERVDLLNSLVAVRYAESNALAF